MNSTLTAPTSVAVVVPANALEWAQARDLVQEMFDWLEELSGVDVTDVQASAMQELDDLADIYAPPDGQLFVAKVLGDIAGTTAIHRLYGRVFELKRVYVRPSARGLSLASMMLNAAIVAARAHGARSLVLESHPIAMRTAVEMYRRRGFEEIAPYSDLGTKVDGVITMGLTL